MKTYRVTLTKAYIVTVDANTKKQARNVAEFYTSNIQDISASKDRKREDFSIKEIKCVINESSEAVDIKNIEAGA